MATTTTDTHAEEAAETSRHGHEALVRAESGPLEHAPVGNTALWTGVLAGPITFLALLETNYVIEEWACQVGYWWPMHVVAAVATAIAVLSLLLSWRNWVAAGREWPGDAGGSVERARFLGALGVITSFGFILVMIAQWIPVMILGPCQHS